MASTLNLPVETSSCPYWSDSTKNCLISKQGLYLPVSWHISTYCRTDNHPFCPRFEQYGADRLEREVGSEKVADRRQYARISGSFPLRLTELRKDGSLTAVLEKKIATVDLSFHGIRLQSYRELPVETIVSFSLNKDTGPPVQGIGMVKWCRFLNDRSGYHAGITFTDGSTSGSVRRLIDVMIKQKQTSC